MQFHIARITASPDVHKNSNKYHIKAGKIKRIIKFLAGYNTYIKIWAHLIEYVGTFMQFFEAGYHLNLSTKNRSDIGI